MASEGEFPKADGDILYGSEANDFYNYPKVLYYGTGGNFTPTKTDSMIVITAAGTIGGSSGGTGEFTGSATLTVDGSSVHAVSAQFDTYGTPPNTGNVPFSLLYKTEDMAMSAVPVAIVGASGNILVMEYLK